MLTEQEDSDLRQFCKIVDDINDCRFYRQLKEQDLTIHIDFVDQSKSRFPQFDSDDFRSFATLFRKLIADGETTTLNRALKIAKRFAPAGAKGFDKRIKDQLRQEAENPPLALAIGPPGAEVSYAPKRICDVFFNGMIFHSDHDKQDDLAKILDFEPHTMTAFLRYACLVVKVSKRCARAFKDRNFFRNETATT